ncbi:flagellar biosynthesis regulator FlaF [Amaricoccus solimangrovi]|uniref:Flagellar biosynthesis regulator FlaF n=1 Tax=Amaricoccus solimangrovi TaxID=2589815 RepID=A0A501WST3_9RHOB|nr:flagellar biosynthesis regulator FlaF [Amaricoccus solimangrovi]TPE52489.1 flagellar biosynthesis regulator FlaF [Amaricoccus solimangrovi]
MNLNARARSGYGAAAAPIRTDRGAEYAIFAKITHRLSEAEQSDKNAFPKLAAAVCDNQRLWGALRQDLMSEGNGLPIDLRARLIGLAEFVRGHSLKVLAGEGSLLPLIDINTAIMRGLRGEAEAAA